MGFRELILTVIRKKVSNYINPSRDGTFRFSNTNPVMSHDVKILCSFNVTIQESGAGMVTVILSPTMVIIKKSHGHFIVGAHSSLC